MNGRSRLLDQAFSEIPDQIENDDVWRLNPNDGNRRNQKGRIAKWSQFERLYCLQFNWSSSKLFAQFIAHKPKPNKRTGNKQTKKSTKSIWTNPNSFRFISKRNGNINDINALVRWSIGQGSKNQTKKTIRNKNRQRASSKIPINYLMTPLSGPNENTVLSGYDNDSQLNRV